MDIADYARREGLLSFTEKPLSDVDGVILAQLAYMDFDYLFEHAVHSTADFTSDMVMRRCVRDTWNPEGNFRLLQAMHGSNRYGQLSWSAYKNHLDLAKEQQFTAITLHLGQRRHYLAFRGTSAALVDWKEDLNMTFLHAIPSQLSAVDYLEKAAERYEGELYLGGHSKGGNLAIYAAVNAPERIRQRIRGIYSADGPGIKQQIPGELLDRVHKIIPESSVIGLLLEPGKNYTVAVSSGRGIAQHDPFTWAVEDDHFLTVGAISGFSQFTEKSVSRWLEQVDDATKQEFLESLFAVFAAARFSELPDVIGDVPRTMRIVRRSVRGMDASAQRQWRSVTDAFVGAIVSEARTVMGLRANSLLGDVGSAVKQATRAPRECVEDYRNVLRKR